MVRVAVAQGEPGRTRNQFPVIERAQVEVVEVAEKRDPKKGEVMLDESDVDVLFLPVSRQLRIPFIVFWEPFRDELPREPSAADKKASVQAELAVELAVARVVRAPMCGPKNLYDVPKHYSLS